MMKIDYFDTFLSFGSMQYTLQMLGGSAAFIVPQLNHVTYLELSVKSGPIFTCAFI